MVRKKEPPSPWVAVGRAVRDARTRRGWSQQTLASKADVSLSTITALETAKRNSYQLMKVGGIWRTLGLPQSDLNRLLDAGGITPIEDPEVAALRGQVEASGLSDRIKQTILTLIDSEVTSVTPKGETVVTSRKHA